MTRTSLSHRIFVGLLVFATTAWVTTCSSDSQSATWGATIDTLPNGRVVVHNPKRGVWDRTGKPWRVEQVARIGAAEDTGPDVFSEVLGIAVDGAGRIWVFDLQAQELRVFDADGGYVRTVGRKGAGPGEFRDVSGMAWSPSGDLWVADRGNGRYTVIDTAGRFVTSHRAIAIGEYGIVPWPGGFDAEGQFVTYVPDPAREFGRDGILLVAYDSTMTPLDTVVPPRWDGPSNVFEYRQPHGSMSVWIPFSPRLVWALEPTGHIWFASTGEYRILEIGSSGDTVREIERDFDPVPVTAADLDSAVAALGWFTRQGGTIDRSKIPTERPAIQDFWVGDDGTLWVLPVTAATSETDRVLDVFAATGTYLGRVSLPFRLFSLRRPVFRNGMIYAVTRDTLDVPYVVSARVVKP